MGFISNDTIVVQAGVTAIMANVSRGAIRAGQVFDKPIRMARITPRKYKNRFSHWVITLGTMFCIKL